MSDGNSLAYCKGWSDAEDVYKLKLLEANAEIDELKDENARLKTRLQELMNER